MNATGIVRRIDNLGRVVVPKELRKTLHIRDGDPLEVYLSSDSIMLKKYSPATGELEDASAKDYAKTLAEVTEHIALVADTNAFIAVAGVPQREYLGKPIPDSWLKESKNMPSGIFEDKTEDGVSRTVVYCNIFAGEKVVGLVAICPKDSTGTVGDLELKLAETAASFIGKQVR